MDNTNIESLDKYYDDLIDYTNNLIDKSFAGEIDLKCLKKIIIRQEDENHGCFTYYSPFSFTDTKNSAGIKNTKDILVTTSKRDFEDEKKGEGYVIIFVRCVSDDSDDSELNETDKIMLTFAYFYRKSDSLNFALQKTKEEIKKMNSFDWFDEKHAFIKKLQTK